MSCSIASTREHGRRLRFALHFGDGQQLIHMCCAWPLVSALLLAVVLLSLPCKGWAVLLSHYTRSPCFS